MILTVLTVLVLLPIIMFTIECFLSILPRRKQDDVAKLGMNRPRLAVLIPAHNEQDCIAGVVKDALLQLNASDQVLVVADNCTDDTAQVATDSGAQAIKRVNLAQRGKSYALQFGIEQLAESPPEIVIFVDADCRISPTALSVLATEAKRKGRPIQGCYLFEGKRGSAQSNLASSLTLRFKNQIRPLGSSRIGMPCQLTGSGIAVPWHVLERVNVANGSLTEDAELGIDLAMAGFAPHFCEYAKIDGNVPKQWGAHVQQRRRWEQGYLQSTLTRAPKMLIRSLVTFDLQLLWLTLDLCIPPLALLAIIWGATFVIAVGNLCLNSQPAALLILAGGANAMAASIFIGWFAHCRTEIPFGTLLSVPWFVVRKFSIYLSLLLNPQKSWLRTDRD